MPTDCKNIETQVVHAGQMPDPTTGAVTMPIYATSTYVQQSPGVHSGFEYARAQNPTRFAYERCMAELENGSQGFAFASGLAASTTVLELLEKDSHIIAGDDLYGGTCRLFERVKKPSSGLSASFVDLNNIEALKAALRPNTKMIWIESPSNPLLKLNDLAAIAAFAKQHQLIALADNTFATPYAQRPLDYGFDLVLHSATKYLNGHSDIISGVVVVGKHERQIALREKMMFLQNALGAIASPFDSFLVLRGLKTLALRMERHSQNAMQLATWLEQHSKVKKVYYPGLLSHPQHALAKQQMRVFGGMISIELDTDLAGSKRFLSACQVFTLAESLGGVESLIEHPAIMTHASLSPEQQAKAGIGESLIRISVGIEHIDDLQADLERALLTI